MVDVVPGRLQGPEQVGGHVLAGRGQAEDGVQQSVAFENGHGVGDACAALEHDAARAAGREERQGGRVDEGQAGGLERLEHDLRAALARLLALQRSLGQEDGPRPRRVDPQLLRERVVPQPLQLVPVVAVDVAAVDLVEWGGVSAASGGGGGGGGAAAPEHHALGGPWSPSG